jgi:hypothetical protein
VEKELWLEGWVEGGDGGMSGYLIMEKCPLLDSSSFFCLSWPRYIVSTYLPSINQRRRRKGNNLP